MATAPLSFRIPDRLAKFDLQFPCPKELEEKAITEVAKQVARTYGRLLTLEGHQNRGKQFFFDGAWPIPQKFPSAEKVMSFEKRLTEKIVETISTSFRHTVLLNCHYIPQDSLSEVLEAEFGYDEYEWHKGYFPCKFHTRIRLETEQKILSVEQ